MTLKPSFVRLAAVATPLLIAGSLAAQDAGADQPSIIQEIFAYQNCGTIGYVIVLMSVIAGALPL
jgi:hypothetical protein